MTIKSYNRIQICKYIIKIQSYDECHAGVTRCEGRHMICEGEMKFILHIQLYVNQNITTICEGVKDKMEKTKLTGEDTAKISGPD